MSLIGIYIIKHTNNCFGVNYNLQKDIPLAKYLTLVCYSMIPALLYIL